MTPMKEDYLKIIFELGGTKKKVSNKQIALSLDIAAGSVTEMVGKLVQEGLAKHTPYAGISLTKKGVRYAETLVRKHRIWEDFLVDKLDYELPDVHTEAEVLEHVTSERLVNALEAYLGNPTHCPHGGAIPDKDGHYQEDSHTSLADTADGSQVTIERFIDNHDLLMYLHEIALKIGQEVTVIKHAPFEGPVTIEVQANGEQIPVSFKAAHNVFVK